MFESADDVAFWVTAFVAAALTLGLMLAGAQWLLNKGFGQKD